jgi:hypothetical protein
VKPKLVEVKLQRIRWQWAAVTELVVYQFIPFRGLIRTIEATGQKEWTDVHSERFFQQIGCRELPTMRLPIASQERPALLVLSLS